MKKSIDRQRGLGWFGLLFVFGTIAFFAIIVVKVGPLYLNHGTMTQALNSIAKQQSGSDLSELRRVMQGRWDVDYIKHIKPQEIKLKQKNDGRYLVYEYEPSVNLFYNVFVVIKFKGEVRLQGAAN